MTSFVRIAAASLLAFAGSASAQWNAANDEQNRQRQMESMRATQAANDRANADRSFQQGLTRSPGASGGSSSTSPSAGSSAGGNRMNGPARDAGPQSVVASRTYTIYRQEAPPQAFARLSQAAANGDAQAQWWVGRMAYAGFGTARDDALARRSFAAAGSQGHVEAASMAGYLAVNGKGGPVDTAGGRALLRRGAEGGDAWGQVQYGLHMIGAANAGETVDLRPVAAMLEQAADRGDLMAQTTLGTTLYFFGAGNIARDEAKMAKYLRLAAAQNQPIAMGELGRLQLTGTGGVARDEAAGVALIRRAAAMNDANAQFLLGVGSISGQFGIAIDKPEGVRLLRAAAAARNMEAMSMMASMLIAGDMVPENMAASIAMAREAADKGDNPSRVLMARALYTGQTVPVDKAASARYARLASDEGFAEGQLVYGQLLFEGAGVTQDRPAAVRLYRRAAAQGFEPARKELQDPEVAPVARTVPN